MSKPIRVIQYGLGPIGCAVARLVTERSGLLLVGAVDVNSKKTGRDTGDVIGLNRQLGFPVMQKLSQVVAEADVVTHCTNSYFEQFASQIHEIFRRGYDICSTSEELSFPWIEQKEAATEIDTMAKKVGKTVLGTGVNPGFLMDSLPLGLTAICQHVDRIDVTRTMNASLRRGPFQAKIGSGLTVSAFSARINEGRMGHVGLPQSIGMVFDTFGKKLVRYASTVEPLIADHTITTDYFKVEPGLVRGLKQVGRGFDENGEFMNLTFIASLDNEINQDLIEITGKPSLRVTLEGTNGDLATVAIVVNAIRRVYESAPGLVTMRDLPIVTTWTEVN